MSTLTATAPAPAPPVWQQAVVSFWPEQRQQKVYRWVPHLPLALILVVQSWVTLRMSNTPFEDEALYIQAGRDYLDHWLHGAPTPTNYGTYFSGAPLAYPVIAASLNAVGGLVAVRLFSLVCMLIATVCVARLAAHWWDYRTGLFAAAVLACCGQVMFLGGLGTFDAPTVACIALALWLGVTRTGVSSAVLVGLLLAAAVVLKYTGIVFVPVVLAVMVLSPRPAVIPRQHGNPRRYLRVLRPVLAALVAGGLLIEGYHRYGPGIAAGVTFTTSGRRALIHSSIVHLAHLFALDLGLVFALALLGTWWAVRTSPRYLLVCLSLLGGSLALPVSQMRLGEVVSFEKHLAYSAVLLAPLAGRALTGFTVKRTTSMLVILALGLVMITGLTRSNLQYQWAPVAQVVSLVEKDPVPGQYLSTSALPMAYYTRDHYPAIHWHDHYGLLSTDVTNWRAVLASREFQVIVLRTGSTGNPTEDNRIGYFLTQVQASPNYRLVTPAFPVRKYATNYWLVFRLAP